MKKKAPIFACALIFLLGLGIMFYPTVSNWVHEQTASYVISDYLELTSIKTEEEAAELFAQASAYNATLSGDIKSFMIAEDNQENNELDQDYWNSFADSNGLIGVIEIPSIDVALPIYHGTDETTLEKGVGHLEGSALPTGEIGNHTVLTGHTGLPSAELFTDLDQLVIGDTFYVQILNKVFTYEVIEINVVLPSETEKLKAQEDKDLVTLVTCTPYGINSHRLLVTGEQIDCTTQNIFSTVTLDNDEKEDSGLDNLPILIGITVVLVVLFGVAIVFTVFFHNGEKISFYKPKKQKEILEKQTLKKQKLISEKQTLKKQTPEKLIPKKQIREKQISEKLVSKKQVRKKQIRKKQGTEKVPKLVKKQKVEKAPKLVKRQKTEKVPKLVKKQGTKKAPKLVKKQKVEKPPKLVKKQKVVKVSKKKRYVKK